MDTGDTTSLRPRTGSRAVERAIAVLYALESADHFIPISELAYRVGLPVSTTHRIAQALVRGRLLTQDPQTDCYGIGDGLLALATSTNRRIDVEAAAPHLHALSSQIRITASLGVAEDDQVVTVYSARPPGAFCRHQIPQPRAPLDATAMGRAIVAFAGRRGRRDGHAPAIDTARRRGYALSDPADVTAIAVPVFDAGGRVRASVSVQALSVRLNPSLISQIYPVMRSTAALLSDSVTEASQRMDPAALLCSTT
jgi:DNA-binding IclR family transcriptional regulator